MKGVHKPSFSMILWGTPRSSLLPLNPCAPVHLDRKGQSGGGKSQQWGRNLLANTGNKLEAHLQISSGKNYAVIKHYGYRKKSPLLAILICVALKILQGQGSQKHPCGSLAWDPNVPGVASGMQLPKGSKVSKERHYRSNNGGKRT